MQEQPGTRAGSRAVLLERRGIYGRSWLAGHGGLRSRVAGRCVCRATCRRHRTGRGRRAGAAVLISGAIAVWAAWARTARRPPGVRRHPSRGSAALADLAPRACRKRTRDKLGRVGATQPRAADMHDANRGLRSLARITSGTIPLSPSATRSPVGVLPLATPATCAVRCRVRRAGGRWERRRAVSQVRTAAAGRQRGSTNAWPNERRGSEKTRVRTKQRARSGRSGRRRRGWRGIWSCERVCRGCGAGTAIPPSREIFPPPPLRSLEPPPG